jgi:RNA polymerase sigma factor (sigma-70 family)
LKGSADTRPEAWKLIASVYGRIYGLAVRMLLDPEETEDATQDIAVKLVRGIPGFRGESSFETWALAVASNHLLGLASRRRIPDLSFEAYESERGVVADERCLELSEGERSLLAEELKIACTLGMLQCLEPLDRLIYALHCFFGISSEEGAAAAGLSAEAYRQRLSRARKRMADFLTRNCGLAGGACSCAPRVDRALALGRLSRERPYSRRARAAGAAEGLVIDTAERAPAAGEIDEFSRTMETLEAEGALFRTQGAMLPEDAVRRIATALGGSGEESADQGHSYSA